jgi:hypothetical protein
MDVWMCSACNVEGGLTWLIRCASDDVNARLMMTIKMETATREGAALMKKRRSMTTKRKKRQKRHDPVENECQTALLSVENASRRADLGAEKSVMHQGGQN